MPCDELRLNQNLVEYIQVLNDIEIICNMVDANYVCIRGDLNTDLMRGSYQTQELVKFVDNQYLCLCVNDPCFTVEYTYCSRRTGVTSQIDHFILSENAINMILTYDSLDTANNFCEHFPVKCTMDYNVEYFNSVEHAKSEITPKPAWYKANDDDIN